MPQNIIPVVDNEGRSFEVIVVSFDNSASVNDDAGRNRSDRAPQYTVEMRGQWIGNVVPQADGTYVHEKNGTVYHPA